ncbi:MAG: hypothetical protein HJJLKODD_02630 [Phycisphaerae bacterium]|nr:hypothetical protein [Phycisphaerae bacterium]
MLRHRKLEHRFVKHVPDSLESGVLYVSVEYGIVSHLCCCGCGEEVVTPLSPTDWRLVFNGETVSLSPSVGNWSLRCRSHYVIDRGRVIEAGSWTEAQIAARRHKDKAEKARYFGYPAASGSAEKLAPPAATSGWWSRIWRWLVR